MLTKEDLKKSYEGRKRKAAGRICTAVAILIAAAVIVLFSVLNDEFYNNTTSLIIFCALLALIVIVPLAVWNGYWSFYKYPERFQIYEVKLRNPHGVFVKGARESILFDVEFTTISGKYKKQTIYVENYEGTDNILKLIDKKGRVIYDEEDGSVYLLDVDLNSKIEDKEV